MNRKYGSLHVVDSNFEFPVYDSLGREVEKLEFGMKYTMECKDGYVLALRVGETQQVIPKICVRRSMEMLM